MVDNTRGIHLCRYCGSADIISDASARWDVDKQEWVITDTNEYDRCENCDVDECSEWVYFKDVPEPVNTRRAVLVDEAEGIEDLKSWQEPTGIIVSNGEKFRVEDISDVKVGDLAILTKINEWQWRVTNEGG